MRRQLFVSLAGIASLTLAACGGGSGDTQPLRSEGSGDDNPATAPFVDISFDRFNPETTDLRFTEGETISFRIDDIDAGVNTASLQQTSGPQVNFGLLTAGREETEDGGLNVSDADNSISFTLFDVEGPRVSTIDRFSDYRVRFQAPSVTESTQLRFQFRSFKDNNVSRSRSIPIIIEDDANTITLDGRVSKGLVKNTRIRLFSIDQLTVIFDGNREIIDPVQIDDTGSFVFTVPPATDFEELLRFEVNGDGADMVCDAPRGCNEFAFGETFEVEKDLDLRALIEIPQLGSTRTTHVNILTTLATKRAGQLNGLRRVSPRDLEDAREDVASVLGLTDQDFTLVPFVDITRPVTSTDQNAIRIAMISGGILGAAFLHADPDDDDDYLEELDDFIDEFGDREVFCQDAPDQTTLSVEDIMVQALEIANLNGDIFSRSYFSEQLADIQSGRFECEFETPPDPE